MARVGEGVRSGEHNPTVEVRPVRVVRSFDAGAAGATDIGRRDHNEDCILLRPELGLFLVADGAGGRNAGNVASAIATTTVANVFETSAAAMANAPEIDAAGMWTVARRLSSAMHRANVEIIDMAKRSAKYQGMGTTLVALAFSPSGDIVHVAHVGDSRCYRFRSGQLEALTADHSLLVDVLEGHPDVDDAVLARAPGHAVTRALGMEESLRVSVRTLRVLAGDVYLLCTDGLTDAVDEATLEAILSGPQPPDFVVGALLEAAMAARAEDNVAVLVVSCHETDDAPKRRPPLRSEPPLSPRTSVSSAPEIIISGVETHVVPADADPLALDTLGLLARLRPSSAPGPVESGAPSGTRSPARCGKCGQPLQRGAKTCPTCGMTLS
jgi:protein phosphatase